MNKVEKLWDAWCIASIIGIWPRFIEPRLIQVSERTLFLPKLHDALDGFKILQFSDLHFSKNTSSRFLEKLYRKISLAKPDLIVFTGDFLCQSRLENGEKLLHFLNKIHAPYGCYAILGNHDYAQYVSINSKGDYDLHDDASSHIQKGFKRLLSSTTLTKQLTERAQNIALHSELISLLKESPFYLLENVHQLIPVKDTYLNLCGLGEYTLGRTNPSQAFQKYDSTFPGIILLHNPDGASLLKNYPGDLILCGHTHGGQVNLPWMWKKFCLLENPHFKRGLIEYGNKKIYVNRGIGSLLNFRWFSMPEILLLTLNTNCKK